MTKVCKTDFEDFLRSGGVDSGTVSEEARDKIIRALSLSKAKEITDAFNKNTGEKRTVEEMIGIIKNSPQGTVMYENLSEDMFEREFAPDVNALQDEVERRVSEIEKLGTDKDAFGNPKPEYLQAQIDLQKYIDEKAGTERGTWGLAVDAWVGNMLFSLSTATKNIMGTGGSYATDVILNKMERYANRDEIAFTAEQKAMRDKYLAVVGETYNKTGVNLARIENQDAMQNVLGEKMKYVADIHDSDSHIRSFLKRVNKIHEKVNYRYFQGKADQYFFNKMFANEVIKQANSIGTQLNIPVQTLIDNAFAVVPDESIDVEHSRIARLIRETAQARAEVTVGAVTYAKEYTDETGVRFANKENSKALVLAESARKWGNELRWHSSLGGESVELGTLTVPFVKTTFNFIYKMLEASPVSAPVHAYKLGVNYMNPETTRSEWIHSLKGVARMIGAVGVGSLLLGLLGGDDDETKVEYVPAFGFEMSEKQRNLRDAGMAYDSFRITLDGKQYSIQGDMFSIFKLNMITAVHLRDSQTFGEGVARSLQSSANMVTRAPVISEILKTLDTGNESANAKGFTGVQKGQEEVLNVLAGIPAQAVHIVMPMGLYYVNKATDEFQRDKYGSDTLAGKALDGVLEKTFRSQLPVDQNRAHEDKRTQGLVELFGNTVRSIDADSIMTEANRLNDAINADVVANVSNLGEGSTVFKKYVVGGGDKDYYYSEARNRTAENINTLLESEAYQSASDEEKKMMWGYAKDHAISTLQGEIVSGGVDADRPDGVYPLSRLGINLPYRYKESNPRTTIEEKIQKETDKKQLDADTKAVVE